MTKVHVIEADMSGSMVDVVGRRDSLGRAIAQLAAKSGEQVYFHDFKDPVAGAPIVLLECSDAFLDQVKTLPGFAKSQDVWPDLATERKSSIQNYFTQPAQPRRPAAPKP